jgi:hypothetical protein
MKKLNLSLIIFSSFFILFFHCQKIEKLNKPSNKNIYWGDLHNHNAVGYARGSLERAYDIAQSHLDFFCFTPHSQWHDMPKMPQNKHMKWINGFKVTQDNWEKVKQYANDFYKPGEFVPFIGYEFHSSYQGDVHIIFPGSEAKFVAPPSVKMLQKFALENDAILIPHHPGYKQDWRGQNWDVLGTTDVSPVVEIFSEHGNAESDRAPYRYIRHSMGGRFTKNTIQWLWEQGVQVGVVASTDDHLGYPGAYGEGLVAVLADTLTRESIMEAIKARRTYGVSADRIELDFQINGSLMGEKIQNTKIRNIFVNVKGKDVVDHVEILRNNQVIYRNHPVDLPTNEKSWEKPVLCRIEFGWGPWGDLNMARVCDWQFDVSITDGKILSVTPCFQSGPYDENKRNIISKITETGCKVTSYTSRKQAYEERATNSIILEIQGSPTSQISMSLIQPCEKVVSKTLAELEKSTDIFFTGPFTTESIMFHRVVFNENYQTEFEFKDVHSNTKTDWYYARVVQANGSLAWSSPIWIEGSE